MKKALTISGRVELSREEITKAIIKFLKETENLATEKVVYEIDAKSGGVPMFTGVVAYVHQAQEQDEVPQFGKERKETVKPTYANRPNWGIGSALSDILNPGLPLTFQSIWMDVKDQFPKLTQKNLQKYLLKKEMTKFEVTYYKERGVKMFQKTEMYVKKDLQDHISPLQISNPN